MAKLASNVLLDIFVSFCAIVFCVVPTVCSDSHLQRLYLPSIGPESSVFDSAGIGPYTGIADGRILKYTGLTQGFIPFAYTARYRPPKFCDGINSTAFIQKCGRPLGLGFYYKTGQLFAADAFYGLMVVGPRGGLAKQLANSADGVPFKFTDGLDIDQITGTVYFTDASANYDISQVPELIENGDTSGRLLKYDIGTRTLTVLLSGLAAPAGVGISADGSYLLFSELIKNRVQKYWLTGPKANTAEVLLNLSGNPDNIKRTAAGDFWVAVSVLSQGNVLLQGQRINGDGHILEIRTFSPDFDVSAITEVNEYNRSLFLGSLYADYIGDFPGFLGSTHCDNGNHIASI